jgi:hypothetical protein
MKIKNYSANEGEYNDASVQPFRYSGLVLEHQTLRRYRLPVDPVVSTLSRIYR